MSASSHTLLASACIAALAAMGAMACQPHATHAVGDGLSRADDFAIERRARWFRPDIYTYGAWHAQMDSTHVAADQTPLVGEDHTRSVERIDTRVRRDGAVRVRSRCTQRGFIELEDDASVEWRTYRPFECQIKTADDTHWRLRLIPSLDGRDDLVASLRSLSTPEGISLDIMRAQSSLRPVVDGARRPAAGYNVYLGGEQVAAVQTKGTPTFHIIRGLDARTQDVVAAIVPTLLHLDADLER